MRGGGKWTCENKVLPTPPHHVTSLRLNLTDYQGGDSGLELQVEQAEEVTTGCFPCRRTKKRKKVPNGQPFSTRGFYFKKYLSRGIGPIATLTGATAGVATIGAATAPVAIPIMTNFIKAATTLQSAAPVELTGVPVVQATTNIQVLSGLRETIAELLLQLQTQQQQSVLDLQTIQQLQSTIQQLQSTIQSLKTQVSQLQQHAAVDKHIIAVLEDAIRNLSSSATSIAPPPIVELVMPPVDAPLSSILEQLVRHAVTSPTEVGEAAVQVLSEVAEGIQSALENVVLEVADTALDKLVSSGYSKLLQHYWQPLSEELGESLLQKLGLLSSANSTLMTHSKVIPSTTLTNAGIASVAVMMGLATVAVCL
ncbi:hypothetical protein [Anaplasma bovis]|uniref:hypothetical protein n=1 Tax=Anaplasma bovis TaxID=186733 RepID=UPI002FF2B5F5